MGGGVREWEGPVGNCFKPATAPTERNGTLGLPGLLDFRRWTAAEWSETDSVCASSLEHV